jgi:hypothetical protein
MDERSDTPGHRVVDIQTDVHAHATEEKEAPMIHRMVEIAKRASRTTAHTCKGGSRAYLPVAAQGNKSGEAL